MFADEIESYSRSKTLRQSHQKIARLERKVNPTVLQPDAAVPRSVQQILSQQFAKIIQDRRIASRMEAVAAIIHPNPVQLETSCIAANGVPLLENRDLSESIAGEFVGSAYSSGAGAEDHHVGGILAHLFGSIPQFWWVPETRRWTI